MNVLVLGGHGFIGSHVVDALVREGHWVRVLARNPAVNKYRGDWVAGDFLDTGKLSEAVMGMDAVVHCISTTVPATSAADPVYDIRSNLIGTVELLRLMEKHGVPRLIYLSSGGTVYGNPTSVPVKEDAPLNPISSYGAVKVAIEKFIDIARMNWGIRPVILRPSNPFGERQGHSGVQGLVLTVLKNLLAGKETLIYGDGSMIRDYFYVGDLARLIVKALRYDKCGTYNAGFGKGYSINEIVELVEDVTGKRVPRSYTHSRSFDVRNIVLDIESAKTELDWEPVITVADGISRLYDWLKAS